MVLNIITFAGCMIMLILFRKLDKSNSKMSKLRRYSSKMFDEYKKLAESERTKFNDATIEMDILIKKANTLTGNLSNSLIEIEKRLSGLDVEKTNLKRVEDDINIISHAAQDVNKQIEFIAAAKKDFSGVAKKISLLTDDITRVKSETSSILHNYNLNMKEKTDELYNDFILQMNNVKESFNETEDKFIEQSEVKMITLANNYTQSITELEHELTTTGDNILKTFKTDAENISKSIDAATNLDKQIKNLQDTLEDLESNIFNDITEKTDKMKGSISNSHEELSKQTGCLMDEIRSEIDTIMNDLSDRSTDLKNQIKSSVKDFDKTKTDMVQNLDSEISKLYNKLNNVESNVDESKHQLIKTFEHEVDKVRTELDNLSIHAISKKDEIVQATRKEAMEIRDRIDAFEEKFIALESRLIDTAEDKMDHLDSEYQSIELRFKNLSESLKIKEEDFGNNMVSQKDKLNKEFQLLEDRLENIQSEITNYENSNKIFTRTDTMIQKVESSLKEFERILDDSKNKSRELEKFISDSEHIKDLKKTVSREIKLYQAKKDKMEDAESRIRLLVEVSEEVLNKSDSLDEKISKIDMVAGRIDVITDRYAMLEGKIEELNEYEDMISKNLDSVNKSDLIIQTIDSRVKSFQKIIDASGKKADKITIHLREIEENTLILKSREMEIQEVKDKFNDIEGVSALIETRVSQINAMFNKVETLRQEMDDTDERLQLMFDDTDRKIREFADFIKAVDKSNPIMKQVKANNSMSSDVNDNTIKTIRNLSDKGWNPDEISKKLMMDENTVRLIINTASL